MGAAPRPLLPDGAAEAPVSVVISSISYSDVGDVRLAGLSPRSDAAVRIYIDNRVLLTAPVGEDGNWQADLPSVDTGVYTLRVDELDPEGRVTSRFETPFLREDPEAVAAMDAPERGGRARAVTVQPGFTLWGIASENYGSGQLYVQIFNANRSQIRDPDLIYPGQIFDIPDIGPTGQRAE
jgi:hypothetical protein